MIKCFLSHSSKDKQSYIRHIIPSLNQDSIVYDELTFEEGLDPAEEIISGLQETDLFVLFLSDSSLNSDWVQKEINLAKNLYDQGALSRIFPIIIDKNISYEDVRISQWMKETKNIQHIVAPKTAARKINQRLTVLAWETHPSLKSKHNFFVGRNDKIANIEMRLDDFAKKTVSTLFVTGLPSIGRKTFIKHSLTKANLIRDYYNFLTISLESNSGIEDFILKLIDLGFTDHTLEENLITKSIDNKIEIAVKILKNLKPQKERLLIEDNGVLVQGNGNLADWFSKILDQLKSDNYLSLVIACIHKPTRIYNEEHYFQQELFELTKPERNRSLAKVVIASSSGLPVQRLS